MTPVTDAMIESGMGAWLDNRGMSDRAVLTAIYLAMRAARTAMQRSGCEQCGKADGHHPACITGASNDERT